MKIGFFGTPHFAKALLSDLLESQGIEVVFVVTNPDASVGRSSELRPSPVKILALEAGIPVFTPEKVRGNLELFKILDRFSADFFVVAAYGKILPKEILEMPKKLPINVHGSILPKYRGASPIQAALLSGEKVTGVTIMVMSEGMDEGDILATTEIPIDRFETTTSLFAKFEAVSGDFLVETLRKFEKGEVERIPQDGNLATYCSKISKESGRVDWTHDAEAIFFQWRGYFPWPGIFTFFREKRLVIEWCEALPEKEVPPNISVWEIFRLPSFIAVRCGQGALILKRLKIEWKPSREVSEFVNGYPDFIGTKLS